jgi:hypothetical protein
VKLKIKTKMKKVSINQSINLSEHFTLGEVTKSKHAEVYNIPSHVAIENLKRVCAWLEELRERYNRNYVLVQTTPTPPRSALPLCSAKNSGGEASGRILPLSRGSQRGAEEPIVINSGYRSPQLNKKVGGSPTSNHLTGCAVDIRVYGIEQAMRYAVILMDYADETKQDYDELLIERNKSGGYWLHFAVRPKENRRKVAFMNDTY